MSTNGQFWLGLAFAIPLSIVANLFTPKIQDWLSKRSKAATERREAVRAKEQDRIDFYAKNPVQLNSFLLTILIVATMFGAGIGVFTAILYMTGAITEGRFGSMLAQALSVFGGLAIAKVCYDAANLSIKVKEAQKSMGSSDN
jgi:hypothetical protein